VKSRTPPMRFSVSLTDALRRGGCATNAADALRHFIGRVE